ncbi:MAG: Sapep family Mn(2+)-dependent dipeptidase [Clostridia bacterium]|nr:Sapep family Mn(2+)-dependent dipeptidase [Clostridia bacterium]
MREFYKSLAGLMEIPSVMIEGDETAPFGAACAKALDYVLELCSGFGFRTKKCGNMLGWAEIGEGDEMVGILAHLDVVPAGNGWDYPAFGQTEVEVDGEKRLYGRGICDDKGPAMMSIYSMKKLLDSGEKLTRRIRLIFGLAEERGEWEDMKYYSEHEELPTFGITPDATFPAVYGEKGIFVMELHMPKAFAGIDAVSGGSAHNVVPDSCKCEIGGKTYEAAGKSAHGSTPTKGVNAILACMKQVEAENSCNLSKFICSCFDEKCDGSLAGCGYSDEESGALTLNVGVIDVCGDDVVIEVDIRYPVTFRLETIRDSLCSAVAPYGVTCGQYEHKAPIYTDKNGALITALMGVYRDVTGDDAEPFVMGGGTYARAMPNIVAFGPMFLDSPETEHQKNEYMRESDLIKARKIYDAALYKMLKL